MDKIWTGSTGSLDSLSDVVARTPDEGDVLTYVAATASKPGYWTSTPPRSGGGVTGTYIFNQGDVSDSWSISHGLGAYPSVTIVDTSNDVVYADVHYVDANNLTVSFAAPLSGKAYLN